MNFYFLTIEQFDGFKYNLPQTFSYSEEEIKLKLSNFKIELYKSVEIKHVSLPIEEVIALLLNNVSVNRNVIINKLYDHK